MQQSLGGLSFYKIRYLSTVYQHSRWINSKGVRTRFAAQLSRLFINLHRLRQCPSSYQKTFCEIRNFNVSESMMVWQISVCRCRTRVWMCWKNGCFDFEAPGAECVPLCVLLCRNEMEHGFPFNPDIFRSLRFSIKLISPGANAFKDIHDAVRLLKH